MIANAITALAPDAADWIAVFARLHPVVLHLPVGLLVALALIEVAGVSGARKQANAHASGRGWLVLLLALAAPLTATSGWLLRSGGEYGDAGLWHQRLGIALAVVAVGIGIAFRWAPRSYARALALGVLLLVPTVYLGSTLTHGKGFLFGPRRATPETPVAPEAHEAPLARAEDVGSRVAPGRATAPGRSTSEVDPAVLARTVASLRERLIHVERLAADTDRIGADFNAAALEPGELRALLAPLGPLLCALDLSGKTLDADDLEFLASLPQLEVLGLRRLQGEPLELAALSRSASLRTLNLSGTRVGPDAERSIDALASIASLQRVYLWNTGLGPSDLKRLSTERPDTTLVGASDPPNEALEIEPEVAFTRVEKTVRAPGDLTAENATCPVSGGPVDPRYLVVHEGRVIGFCCENCPKTFWEDPARVLAELDRQ